MNFAASLPPSEANAVSILFNASAWAWDFKITDYACPSDSRICACFSASAILMLASISPSEVRILALFLLSASAWSTIDF